MINEVIKTIYQRRAIRKFMDKNVDKHLIDQIIDAGKMAPSAMNMQPWKFYVLTNKETILSFSGKIGKASLKGITKIGFKTIIKSIASFIHSPHDLSFFKGTDFIFHGAPVVIFLTAPKDNEWAALDVGMCAQNMMLAAQSFGLSSCPVGLAKFVEDTDVYDSLNIPNTEHVLLAIIFGYSNESHEAAERRKDNVHFME